MKLFKKLASIATACTLALSFCAFSTACNDDTESSSPEATAYTFNVENVNGRDVSVQLCIYENGEQTACYMPIKVDENGECVYNPQGFPGEGNIYAIHVLENGTTQMEFEGPESTEAEYGEYTLILQ